MKTILSFLLALVTVQCQAAWVQGCIRDITDQPYSPGLRFFPLDTPLADGTNTVWDVPRPANVAKDGTFKVWLVGGRYNADAGPVNKVVKIAVPPHDTNTYSFNQCAQWATNVFPFPWTNPPSASASVLNDQAVSPVPTNAAWSAAAGDQRYFGAGTNWMRGVLTVEGGTFTSLSLGNNGQNGILYLTNVGGMLEIHSKNILGGNVSDRSVVKIDNAGNIVASSFVCAADGIMLGESGSAPNFSIWGASGQIGFQSSALDGCWLELDDPGQLYVGDSYGHELNIDLASGAIILNGISILTGSADPPTVSASNGSKYYSSGGGGKEFLRVNGAWVQK